MRLLEGYSYVLTQLNKLITNTNQKIPKYIFVQSFNKNQFTWLSLKLNSEEINKTLQRNLHQLIETENLKLSSQKDIYNLYTLPDNYYHTSSIIGKTNTGCYIEIDLVEEGNAKDLYKNDMSAPSLQFEQSFATLVGKDLKVYKKDFEFSTIEYTYYRKPNKVDLASGYKNLDGKQSTNIDTEWEDDNLYEILDLVVRDLAASVNDTQRFQTSSVILKDELT